MRRPQNLKKSPTCFDETAVFTQYKTSGRFLQIFVAFSEKLDFINSLIFVVIYDIWKKKKN